ncbi:GNAT family N-acetyltransferase [Nitrosopumilus sp.]|jgi:RimJ/RimL family protein N-acetyltransferase|nr:GNAT family N-acetyltransferase [Nitrosopumilus sp.]
MIILRKVSENDNKFLYNLLKERDSNVNISHKKMPKYSEHIKFLASKPYSKWYIIEYNKKKSGSIYLSKNNEIGIFVKKSFRGNKIGENAVKLLIEKYPKSRYLANINPKNKESIKFFKKFKFKLIQHTFELIPEN